MMPNISDTIHHRFPKNYTLDFKIGQMVMVGFRGTEIDANSTIVQAITDYHLGGVWLTDNESPMGYTYGNIRSAGQLSNLNKALQSYSPLPLFISIDAEGGHVIRLKEKFGFPATVSARFLGELNDTERTYNEALKIARLIKTLGINFNFAPVVDLNLNPNHASLGLKKRCFSDDPDVVVRHAVKVIQANHEAGILCCIKHFPGHGSARDDSHTGFVDVSDTWQEKELSVYEDILNKVNIEAVLTAHILLKRFDPEFPATLSKNIINGLLRSALGFPGIVISDDMNMGAIKQNYSYEVAIERAINAGVDIILQSNVDHYDEYTAQRTIEIIRRLVDRGNISEERIDQSFKKILHLKNRLN